MLFGSQFFPKFILYGNAYKGLKNGYEAQAGIRYAYLQNDISFITLNLGASKTWEDILLSAKVSLMRDDIYNYFNFSSQAKINVNAKGDYVNFIASFGSAPFNDQLPEGAAAFLDFSNVLVGAGYGHNISPRTMLLLNGSWINFKSPITDSTSIFFINQYNLSVSIITKF